MTEIFWALLGYATFVAVMVSGAVCLFHGWPRLFTINIHKHYHNKEKD